MQKKVRRNAKRALVIVLILVMSFGMLQIASAIDYDNHWSKEFIEDAKARGWMGGYEDGTFRPDNSITRAEFAVMLWRALGEPDSTANPFTDVPAGEWYAAAAAALYEDGVVTGTGNGEFSPSTTLTREMGFTMLARAFDLSGGSDAYTSFSDAASVSDWAREAVSALYEKGYINGMGDNQCMPKNPMKRGEMAKLLITIFDGEEGSEPAETESNLSIALSHSPTSSTSGSVTVTVTATSDAAVNYIGMRESSSGAAYTDKTGFTDITAAKKFTVSKNGWYAVCATDEDGGFAFKLIQITNITSSSGGGGGKSPTTKKYTVTFNANGGTLTGDATVSVEDGKTVTKPTDPTNYTSFEDNAVGRMFEGWYYNGTKWNFETPITSDGIVLTAKWGATVILEELFGFQDITVKIEGVTTLEQSEKYTVEFNGTEMTFKTNYEGFRTRIDLQSAAAPSILEQMAKIKITEAEPVEPPQAPEFSYKKAKDGTLIGEVLLSAALEGVTTETEAAKWSVYYLGADGTTKTELAYNKDSTLFIGTVVVRAASDVGKIDDDAALAAVYTGNIKCEPRTM